MYLATMVIFHGYVTSPKGIWWLVQQKNEDLESSPNKSRG